MTEYRNVTVADDGIHIEGERTLGSDSWIRFSAHPKLLRISEALDRFPGQLDDPVWDLQDGYGEAGYTPPQGWDWSGIRDSSPEALDAMFALASEYLTDSEMDRILGL